jgi:membrane-associated phospholipid phosphatase
MKKLLTELKSFLIVCLIFISTALLGVFAYGKKPLHLFINQFHSPFQDTFFKYFTNVGDGLFAGLILFVLLFFINIRNIFIGLATFLISGFISQLIKKVAFFDELRPSKFFGSNELYLVPGELLHYYNSFPSGHSTTAFAMSMFLAYLFKKKYLQVTFAIIACLVAYSRVYLSQHFFIDVACGGIIGMTSFICSYFIFKGVKVNWFDKTILSMFHQNQLTKN